MQLRDVALESQSLGDLNAVRQQITEELWIALIVRILQLILPNGILRKDYLCVEKQTHYFSVLASDALNRAKFA